MSDEEGHVKLLQHSIQHLIPLEVSTEDTSEDTTNELPPPIEDTQSPSQGSTRSKCRVAVEGEIIRQSWTYHHRDNVDH